MSFSAFVSPIKSNLFLLVLLCLCAATPAPPFIVYSMLWLVGFLAHILSTTFWVSLIHFACCFYYTICTSLYHPRLSLLQFLLSLFCSGCRDASGDYSLCGKFLLWARDCSTPFWPGSFHCPSYDTCSVSTYNKPACSPTTQSKQWRELGTTMTSLRCYGNSDLDKINRTRNFGLSLASVRISTSCMF